jgi:hypothetical protein
LREEKRKERREKRQRVYIPNSKLQTPSSSSESARGGEGGTSNFHLR